MLPPRPPPGGASAAAQPPWRPWSAPLFESELQRVPMLWDDPVRFRMTNMTAKMAEAGLINPGDPATPLPARRRVRLRGDGRVRAARGALVVQAERAADG